MKSEIPSFTFEENYEAVKQLGEGTFAKVIQAIDLQKDQNCAVKQIYIQKYMLDDVYSQILNLKKLHNQHIISYNQSFYDEDEFNLNLVMEICKGSLRGQLQHNQFFNEGQLRSFLVQMTSAFLELDRKNIMHLDFKPQNVLIVNQQGNYYKICDFGCSQLSNFSKLSGYDNNTFGTFNYLAPEIHLNYKGKMSRSSADMWSLGVTIYEMIFWKLPFSVDKDKISKRQEIVNFFQGNLQLNFGMKIGGPLKIVQILKMMLKRDPIERLTWMQMKTQLKQTFSIRQFEFIDVKQTIDIVNETLQLFLRVIKTIQAIISQKSHTLYTNHGELLDNFYCSFVNYAFHIGKYYQTSQKYRFQNQNVNMANRVKCNKLINEIDSLLKRMCIQKGIAIQFDLNVVRQVEIDFQEDLKQFKQKLAAEKAKNIELNILMSFCEQMSFSLAKIYAFLVIRTYFIAPKQQNYDHSQDLFIIKNYQ